MAQVWHKWRGVEKIGRSGVIRTLDLLLPKQQFAPKTP